MKNKTQNYRLQVSNCELRKSGGFTLVELLLTMAIIAILAGAILVSLSSQRKKANQGKLLAEFSGTIQPMLMCKSDGEAIAVPSNGGNICTGEEAYGVWPDASAGEFTGYHAADSDDLNDGNWYFYAEDDDMQVCCNNASSKCQLQTKGSACDADTPAQ